MAAGHPLLPHELAPQRPCVSPVKIAYSLTFTYKFVRPALAFLSTPAWVSRLGYFAYVKKLATSIHI